jgi:LptD protein
VTAGPGRWIVAILFGVATAQASFAQIVPVRPPIRGSGGLQPVRRDTVPDSTAVVWPTPDSVAQSLLNKRDYTITRYQGDTAFFNAQRKALDLLAAGKRRAIVDRDSQVVVSDSGIYYSEASRDITAGGHYVISPGGGQAPIKGVGRTMYNLADRSVSVTNARFPVNNGDMWYLQVGIAKVIIDSTSAKKSTLYARGGSITSCDDSIPDYHFEYREAKRTGNNTIVARPAVLYIKDIPVMWFPFIFSDTRSGRHSGILPPQFGVGDIVRNSPTYRRHVDRAGYYWALSDYMDVGTWIDWRSSAGAVNGDPGWIRYNADWDYKWINRFLSGRIGVNYLQQADSTHATNLGISWSHNQDFSHDAHLNTSLNYVTSTTLQRQNTFNPIAAIATIASAATFQNKFGPASISIGGTRKQYPGRIQVDESVPTINLTTTPLTLGQWLSWTPTMSYSRNDSHNIDQPGVGSVVFRQDPVTLKPDSVLAHGRSSSKAALSFDTPLQIFGRDFKNSFRVTQQRNDFPQQIGIYDLISGEVVENRVYAATYYTYVDWIPEFTLPSLARNKFNLTPSISLQNVDPGAFWVASERTNGKFVSQKKRLTYGVSASPTIFGLFRGFGPFSRLRHSITPSIGYNFAPASQVSDDYLLALGRTKKGYLGNLRQNAINFGLTQNLEAKVRPKNDTSGTDKGEIIRLISINMTPINYDFERAHASGVHSKWAGLTTETWGYSLSSELLPGFDFSSNYSLFQGSTLSDTARFAPVLTSISASFNIGKGQNPLAVFARLFGKAVPEAQKSPTPATDQVRPRSDDTLAAIVAATPVAGSARGGDRFIIPPSQGWRAQFQFSRSSPRAPVGTNVVEFDPRKRCETIAAGNPFLFNACVAQIGTQPTVEQPITTPTGGAQLYAIPPTTSLNSNISFNLTPKWATQWQTTYDLERHEFASQIVSLQRELHDWRAIFGFTQSPNGNFAFNFTIALKAEPDLKFDYNRATVRSGSSFTGF